MTLWLVRHGRTAWNAERRYQGWADIPLDRVGRRQARRLRPALGLERFDGVWSSDLQRACQTALLAYGEAVTDPRLREIDFGDIEGLTWEDLDEETRAGLLAFEDFTAPGGEAYQRFRGRVIEFVDALPPGNHLVFTHGGVLRLLARDRGTTTVASAAHTLVVDWV